MEFDNDSLFDQKERKRKTEPKHHHRYSSYGSMFTGRHLKRLVLLEVHLSSTGKEEEMRNMDRLGLQVDLGKSEAKFAAHAEHSCLEVK